MRMIKVEIVRTITSTETFKIKMSDAAATKFLSSNTSKTKEQIAEDTEEIYQHAKRKLETASFTSRDEVDNIEKVNYVRYRDCTGDN